MSSKSLALLLSKIEAYTLPDEETPVLDRRLDTLGLDSFRLAQLVLELEDDLGTTFEQRLIERIVSAATVREMAEALGLTA